MVAHLKPLLIITREKGLFLSEGLKNRITEEGMSLSPLPH